MEKKKQKQMTRTNPQAMPDIQITLAIVDKRPKKPRRLVNHTKIMTEGVNCYKTGNLQHHRPKVYFSHTEHQDGSYAPKTECWGNQSASFSTMSQSFLGNEINRIGLKFTEENQRIRSIICDLKSRNRKNNQQNSNIKNKISLSQKIKNQNVLINLLKSTCSIR